LASGLRRLQIRSLLLVPLVLAKLGSTSYRFGLYKATFVVWGAAFGVHFLVYLPRMLRSLRDDWSARRRRAVGGAGLRVTLVGSAFGSGLVLALALLPTIDAWQDALT
jgi:hypothetical protein